MEENHVLEETDQLLKEINGKLKQNKKKNRRGSRSHRKDRKEVLRSSRSKMKKSKKKLSGRKISERLTYSVGIRPPEFRKDDEMTRRETFADRVFVMKSERIKEEILNDFDEVTDKILGDVDGIFDGLLAQLKI